MSESDIQKIKEKILGAVHDGQVKMRPRWKFILRGALIGFIAFGIFLALFYLASFIVFVTRRTGVWFVPEFGLMGWLAFMTNLPWLLIACAVFFGVILAVLLKRYEFTYRQPLIYSALAIVGVVSIGGAIILATPLHHWLAMHADSDDIPVAGPFYRAYGGPKIHNIHPGVIVQMEATGFNLKNRRGEVLNIVVTPNTRLPLGDGFTVNDWVVVFGERDDHTVTAVGVRKVTPE